MLWVISGRETTGGDRLEESLVRFDPVFPRTWPPCGFRWQRPDSSTAELSTRASTGGTHGSLTVLGELKPPTHLPAAGPLHRLWSCRGTKVLRAIRSKFRLLGRMLDGISGCPDIRPNGSRRSGSRSPPASKRLRTNWKSRWTECWTNSPAYNLPFSQLRIKRGFPGEGLRITLILWPLPCIYAAPFRKPEGSVLSPDGRHFVFPSPYHLSVPRPYRFQFLPVDALLQESQVRCATYWL